MKNALEMNKIAQMAIEEKKQARREELAKIAERTIEEVILPEAQQGKLRVEIGFEVNNVEVLSVLRKQGFETRYKTFSNGKEWYVIDWSKN